MSPRFLIGLLVAAIVAFGSGVALWAVIQPEETGPAIPVAQTPSDADRLEHREKFFGGDPDRDVRGGQEMKPRW